MSSPAASEAGSAEPWSRRDEYFPYGRPSDRRDSRNRYRFIGVERDEETGMCMTGPRLYDPVSGRFLQGDAKATEKPGWVPFNYCKGSPIRLSDSNGYDDAPTDDPANTLAARQTSLLAGGIQGLGEIAGDMGATWTSGADSIMREGLPGALAEALPQGASEWAGLVGRDYVRGTAGPVLAVGAAFFAPIDVAGRSALSAVSGDPSTSFASGQKASPFVAAYGMLALGATAGTAAGRLAASSIEVPLLNIGGEGEVPAVLNLQGRWALDPAWRSAGGQSLAELQGEGHAFSIADNTSLPFEDASVGRVITNSAPIDQDTWLGPGVQSSEVLRVLAPSGEWVVNGVARNMTANMWIAGVTAASASSVSAPGQ